MDERLSQLLDLLDAHTDETVGTSVRLPANLRAAASLATELGFAESTSELAVHGLRDAIDALVQRAVLDAHYAAHPSARPDLSEIAQAAAELDDSPLAHHPDLIRRAAREVIDVTANPTPDDVLLYAAGLAAAVA